MRVSVTELKGITPQVAAKLKEKGISDSEQLLAAAKTPKAREELAKAVGAKTADILELANRSDLARIRGIGQVYSDLLENAGVDTVKELAKRVPENLHAKLLEVNAAKKLSGRDPTLDDVKDWVAQAKGLPAALEY
jgi:predicted flap endonuclease-1-like 5' DNA nuclease